MEEQPASGLQESYEALTGYAEDRERYLEVVGDFGTRRDELRRKIEQFGDSVARYEQSGDMEALKAVAVTWVSARSAYQEIREMRSQTEEFYPGALAAEALRGEELESEFREEMEREMAAYKTHEAWARRAAAEATHRENGLLELAEEVAESSEPETAGYFSELQDSEPSEIPNVDEFVRRFSDETNLGLEKQ